MIFLKDVTEKKFFKESIGLKNAAVRLALSYGKVFAITIGNKKGEGSTFTLSFPLLP